ncbi:MAG TPA: hypothetical protein V6C96_00520, partial [Vampirovibrionales bacterium]
FNAGIIKASDKREIITGYLTDTETRKLLEILTDDINSQKQLNENDKLNFISHDGNNTDIVSADDEIIEFLQGNSDTTDEGILDKSLYEAVLEESELKDKTIHFIRSNELASGIASNRQLDEDNYLISFSDKFGEDVIVGNNTLTDDNAKEVALRNEIMEVWDRTKLENEKDEIKKVISTNLYQAASAALDFASIAFNSTNQEDFIETFNEAYEHFALSYNATGSLQPDKLSNDQVIKVKELIRERLELYKEKESLDIDVEDIELQLVSDTTDTNTARNGFKMEMQTQG